MRHVPSIPSGLIAAGPSGMPGMFTLGTVAEAVLVSRWG